MTNNFNAFLYKEFKLALHPAAIIFLSLSFMMLIPNYPLYVTFFYTGLGIFFNCLQSRENHDILYSLTLPVKKRDIVKGRITMTVIIELLQILIAGCAAFIRAVFIKMPNQAGMDANIAFFGLSFVLLGLFNYLFFTNYYKDTAKVGRAFAVSCVFVWIYILAAETCSFAVPFVHNVLDTPDPLNLAPKLAVLAGGASIFAALTVLAAKKSIPLFEQSDF